MISFRPHSLLIYHIFRVYQVPVLKPFSWLNNPFAHFIFGHLTTLPNQFHAALLMRLTR